MKNTYLSVLLVSLLTTGSALASKAVEPEGGPGKPRVPAGTGLFGHGTLKELFETSKQSMVATKADFLKESKQFTDKNPALKKAADNYVRSMDMIISLYDAKLKAGRDMALLKKLNIQHQEYLKQQKVYAAQFIALLQEEQLKRQVEKAQELIKEVDQSLSEEDLKLADEMGFVVIPK